MSDYQVIARKWRPRVFEDISGQEHVTRTLKNAVVSGRIGHAYLFSGPRGVGKTTAARILAKCLNCSNCANAVPCNACESCSSINYGNAVDVIEIDGASNNGVDNIRDLRDVVRYLPGLGKYKIYIIDEVHMLSTAAFNALLKTLEEPPAHAVFILATTEAHKIPATIISRCQRFDFRRIPFKDIQKRLDKIATEEGLNFEEEALYTIAREADGSLRDAQSLLEQAVSFSDGTVTDAQVSEALGLMDRALLHELAKAVLERQSSDCLNIVEKMHIMGYDLKRCCGAFLEHIRDLTVVKISPEGAMLDLPDVDLERLSALSKAVTLERLQMIFSVMSKGYEDVSRSYSPRYALEMSLLKAAYIEDAAPIADLIARLNELKARVGTAGGGQVQGRTMQGQGSNIAALAATPKIERERTAAPSPEKNAPDAAPVEEGLPVKEESRAHFDPQGVLEQIASRIPSLSDDARSAEALITGDTLELKVGANKFAAFNMKQSQIEKLCTELAGRQVRVRIVQTAVKETPGATNASRPANDEAVKQTLKILGGKVIEERRNKNV